MQKIMVCLAMMSLLIIVGGCAPAHISKVQDEPGPPADVVQKGDSTVYFYHTYNVRVSSCYRGE
jgi:hypothetical protein